MSGRPAGSAAAMSGVAAAQVAAATTAAGGSRSLQPCTELFQSLVTSLQPGFRTTAKDAIGAFSAAFFPSPPGSAPRYRVSARDVELLLFDSSPDYLAASNSGGNSSPSQSSSSAAAGNEQMGLMRSCGRPKRFSSRPKRSSELALILITQLTSKELNPSSADLFTLAIQLAPPAAVSSMKLDLHAKSDDPAVVAAALQFNDLYDAGADFRAQMRDNHSLPTSASQVFPLPSSSPVPSPRHGPSLPTGSALTAGSTSPSVAVSATPSDGGTSGPAFFFTPLSPSQQGHSRSGGKAVFGRSLEALAADALLDPVSRAPLFLTAIVHYVSTNEALCKTRGMFRTKANPAEVAALISAIDNANYAARPSNSNSIRASTAARGQPPAMPARPNRTSLAPGASAARVPGLRGSVYRGFTPSDWSLSALLTVFRCWLRDLPSPLIPVALQGELTAAFSGDDAAALSQLLTRVPGLARDVLQFVLAFLAHLSTFEQDTGVGMVGLAVALAPYIFRKDPPTPESGAGDGPVTPSKSAKSTSKDALSAPRNDRDFAAAVGIVRLLTQSIVDTLVDAPPALNAAAAAAVAAEAAVASGLRFDSPPTTDSSDNEDDEEDEIRAAAARAAAETAAAVAPGSTCATSSQRDTGGDTDGTGRTTVDDNYFDASVPVSSSTIPISSSNANGGNTRSARGSLLLPLPTLPPNPDDEEDKSAAATSSGGGRPGGGTLVIKTIVEDEDGDVSTPLAPVSPKQRSPTLALPVPGSAPGASAPVPVPARPTRPGSVVPRSGLGAALGAAAAPPVPANRPARAVSAATVPSGNYNYASMRTPLVVVNSAAPLSSPDASPPATGGGGDQAGAAPQLAATPLPIYGGRGAGANTFGTNSGGIATRPVSYSNASTVAPTQSAPIAIGGTNSGGGAVLSLASLQSRTHSASVAAPGAGGDGAAGGALGLPGGAGAHPTLGAVPGATLVGRVTLATSPRPAQGSSFVPAPGGATNGSAGAGNAFGFVVGSAPMVGSYTGVSTSGAPMSSLFPTQPVGGIGGGREGFAPSITRNAAYSVAASSTAGGGAGGDGGFDLVRGPSFSRANAPSFSSTTGGLPGAAPGAVFALGGARAPRRRDRLGSVTVAQWERLGDSAPVNTYRILSLKQAKDAHGHAVFDVPTSVRKAKEQHRLSHTQGGLAGVFVQPEAAAAAAASKRGSAAGGSNSRNSTGFTGPVAVPVPVPVGRGSVAERVAAINNANKSRAAAAQQTSAAAVPVSRASATVSSATAPAGAAQADSDSLMSLFSAAHGPGGRGAPLGGIIDDEEEDDDDVPPPPPPLPQAPAGAAAVASRASMLNLPLPVPKE